MRPSTRATNSAESGDPTIASSSARLGGGDDEESWGMSWPNASTSSSVTVAAISMSAPTVR